MDINLDYIKTTLSSQNYLEYDKILTSMINATKINETINVIDKNGEIVAELKTYEEMDTFHKRMVQVHGIYGYF